MAISLCPFSFMLASGADIAQTTESVYVRCILVDTTVPVRIRPRIETIPVKGHFLSM